MVCVIASEEVIFNLPCSRSYAQLRWIMVFEKRSVRWKIFNIRNYENGIIG